MRVQEVDGEYRVVLTAEAVSALRIKDGSPVEILNAESAVESGVSYFSVEEAMAAFIETEPEHRQSYLELAK